MFIEEEERWKMLFLIFLCFKNKFWSCRSVSIEEYIKFEGSRCSVISKILEI